MKGQGFNSPVVHSFLFIFFGFFSSAEESKFILFFSLPFFNLTSEWLLNPESPGRLEHQCFRPHLKPSHLSSAVEDPLDLEALQLSEFLKVFKPLGYCAAVSFSGSGAGGMTKVGIFLLCLSLSFDLCNLQVRVLSKSS